MPREIKILFSVPMLFALVLGLGSCNSSHQVQETSYLDCRYTLLSPITQDAIMILTGHDVAAHRAHFCKFVVNNGLTKYNRFLVAQDSTASIFISFPDGQIDGQAK